MQHFKNYYFCKLIQILIFLVFLFSIKPGTDIQLKQKEVVKLQELPNIILKAFGHKIFTNNNNNIKNNNNNASIDLSEVDDELKSSLLPFQKEGVEYVVVSMIK